MQIRRIQNWSTICRTHYHSPLHHQHTEHSSRHHSLQLPNFYFTAAMEVASALLESLIKVSGRINAELQKISNAEESLKKLEVTTIKARELFINGVNTFHLDVDGSLQTVLRNRMDNLTVLCLNAQDLMEDVLDSTNQKSRSSKKWVLKSMLDSPRNLIWPHDIVELQKKLDGIVEQVKDLVDLTSTSRDETMYYNGYLDRTMLNPLIGREDDVEKIIQQLISGDSGHNGVSVLGIDGLGKTMLAEAILLDKRILEQFCFILRVSLSDGIFNSKEATNELVKQLQERSVGKNGVLKQLNPRLLILFDNLLCIKSGDWNGFWDHIKTQLFAANIKVLVTTFTPEVSRITCTTAYYLQRLSDEDCREVIVKKALLCKQDLPQSHLSHIANILARKCEGLPVVARVFGTVLAQCDMNRWGDLLDRDSQDLTEVKTEVVSLLRLSYSTMKPQMKLCLAYFSLFPHKYLFRKNDLIHLWVGQEIISHREGNDCFSDMQGMSILHHSDDGTHLENPIYELHKFSYIFSQLDASTICLRLEEGMSSLPGSLRIDDARHFSFSCSDIQPAIWDKLQKLKHLRTFLSLSDPLNNQVPAPIINQVPPRLFKALSRLRVLSLKGTNITELSDSVHRLKRLRYLDISFTSISKLPETLCELSKLKFLKLKNTEQLFHLPHQFHKLTSMVCIDWELHDIARLALPSHIGKLSSLQTLPLYTVGDDQGGYSISELKDMKCLQGSICIRYLENVKSKAIAEEAMLSNKISLKKLELQWMNVVNHTVAKEVLTGLEPNDCLTELNIKNYGGRMFPKWISNPSRNLRKIHLMRCPSCDILPTLGVLETLEDLVLEDFADVKNVDWRFCGPSSSVTRDGYFRALKFLTFKNLAQLKEWSGLESNDMPRLCILKILSCPRLINLPSLLNLTSLVEIEIMRCQKIRSLPELPLAIESLKISDSNLLKDQCIEGGGDWHKVICIPKVEIDGLEIQTSGVRNDVQTLPNDRQRNIVFQGYRLVKDNVGGILSRLGLRD